jgi:hypothetical protein
MLQPLTTLLEGLDYVDPSLPHYHSPATLVAGYAAASIAMGAMVLESFTASIQYQLGNDKRPEPPWSFVAKKYPDSGYEAKIVELFVVRDAIAHSHMWRRQMTMPPSVAATTYGPFELHDGFGDKKFSAVVDRSVQTTKVLGLHIIPTRLTAQDVAIVMKTLLDFLVFLQQEASDELHRDAQGVLNIENQYVMYRGRIVTFPTVVHTLQPTD